MSHDSTSFLPDNPPPLPSSTPPLPPTPSSNMMYMSSMPPPNSMMPPNMNQMSAAAYQQYYQQYMQYMYSMYGASAAAASTPISSAYYNIPAKQTVTSTPPPSTPTVTVIKPVSEPPATATTQPKPAIKFNLKFQTKTEQAEPVAATGAVQRKTRFNPNSLSNITAEQNNFKKQQEAAKEAVVIAEPVKTVTETTPTQACDIVADINKWPATLKAYCTKVYQFYQKLTSVSEDQVTKYLQQRITDTFKLKPDLNIDWDNEKIPEINEIKLVAPFSQLQLQQQKRQQKVHEAAIAAAKAKAAELLAEKVKLKQQLAEKKVVTPSPTSLAAEISKNKRKYSSRSRSASSSSSTSSSSSSMGRKSEDFISLSAKKTKKNHTMMKIEKKKLKNIQINNLNGKKSFMVSKRKSSDETSDGEDDNEDEDEEDAENFDEDKNDLQNQQQKLLTTPNKFLSNKQKKLKANLITRQKRFQNGQNKNNKKQTVFRNTRTLFSSINKDAMNEDADLTEVCVGLNQDLEKEYLRLTGPPEPAMIRPVNVLKKSLNYVLDKYAKSNDYRYICDQMKAIRQDLTVQMIQNEFTIEVYETHARIAIQNKDRDEFNQCQSQLKNLYSLIEKTGSITPEQENKSAEFIGYRLIYNMLTKSHNDLNQVINEIKRKYSKNQYLNHLLALRNAWHLRNYVKFFRLYRQCNEMSKCLIDLFIERERKLALKIIIKAYRPSIKLECVAEMLAYESVQKCKDDLLAYKLTIQSVPSSDTNSSSITTISSNSKSTNLNNISKTSGLNSNPISKPRFEDVLDCKSCITQF